MHLLIALFLVPLIAAMDSRTFWACLQDPSLAYCPDTPIKDPRKTTTTTTTIAPEITAPTTLAPIAPGDFAMPKPVDKTEQARQNQECTALSVEYQTVCSRKPPKGAELETITFCNMYKQQCLVRRP